MSGWACPDCGGDTMDMDYDGADEWRYCTNNNCEGENDEMAHSACYRFHYASGKKVTRQIAHPPPKLMDLRGEDNQPVIFIQVTDQTTGAVKYHEAKCPTDSPGVWGCPHCGAKETLEHREFFTVCAACQVIIELHPDLAEKVKL